MSDEIKKPHQEFGEEFDVKEEPVLEDRLNSVRYNHLNSLLSKSSKEPDGPGYTVKRNECRIKMQLRDNAGRDDLITAKLMRDEADVIHIAGEEWSVALRPDGTQNGSFHAIADELLQYMHKAGKRVVDDRGNTESFEEDINIFYPKGMYGRGKGEDMLKGFITVIPAIERTAE